MDLDKGLVSAVLREGRPALEKVLALGIASRLQGEGKNALEFVRAYFEQFGSMPVIGQVEGKTGVDLEGFSFALEDTPPNSVDFFVGEVNNRELAGLLQGSIREILRKQSEQDLVSAVQLVQKLAEDLQTRNQGPRLTESLFKIGPEVRAFYERVKSGERGIQTPWPSLNDVTLGFWPEDLVLFAARSSVGKSWVQVLLANYAWSTPKPRTQDPCRVLFITTEMSKLRIGMRFYAVREKLPYRGITHGELSVFEEERMFRAIDDLLSAENLFIIGGDFDFRIETVAAAVEECKPDLIIIDGAYLLRTDGPNRTERMAAIFDEVKRLAKRKKTPTVITTQFNREVKKDEAKTVQMESIALSDAGSWNADLIFGLIQTSDMREERRMIIKPLKVREGEGKEIQCRWDFSRMDFSELNPDGGGGGDADEQGTTFPDNDTPLASDDDQLPF